MTVCEEMEMAEEYEAVLTKLGEVAGMLERARLALTALKRREDAVWAELGRYADLAEKNLDPSGLVLGCNLTEILSRDFSEPS